MNKCSYLETLYCAERLLSRGMRTVLFPLLIIRPQARLDKISKWIYTAYIFVLIQMDVVCMSYRNILPSSGSVVGDVLVELLVISEEPMVIGSRAW